MYYIVLCIMGLSVVSHVSNLIHIPPFEAKTEGEIRLMATINLIADAFIIYYIWNK